MWFSKQATTEMGDFRVMTKGDLVQFPAVALIASGDKFEMDGMSYLVGVTELIRDESILTKVEVIKDDKPTTRRKASKPSGKRVQDEVELRLDCTDRISAECEHCEDCSETCGS